MLSTLILKNQKGLARFNELACPYCEGVVEWWYKFKCLNCGKISKMHELKPISLIDRINEYDQSLAESVFNFLWESKFLELICGCSYDGVIFNKAPYRFYWDYKLWKRLRWIKKFVWENRSWDFFYELNLIKCWIGIPRNSALSLLKEFYVKWEEKEPKVFKKREGEKKEADPFMENITALVSAFIRWYENMYEKVLSEDVTDEDFDKFQEMLGTWITDEEITKLKNWEPVVLSLLVPAIEYLLSKSIRPSVSLLKSSLKINLINDLPSTHPFYDLLHEKPL